MGFFRGSLGVSVGASSGFRHGVFMFFFSFFLRVSLWFLSRFFRVLQGFLRGFQGFLRVSSKVSFGLLLSGLR